MKLSLKDRSLSVFDGDAVVASAAGATAPPPATLNSRSLNSLHTSSLSSVDVSEERTKPTSRDIVALDLSYNNLQVLVRARSLRFLTDLNVGHNHLSSLASLPPTLERLTVDHNALKRLDGIESLVNLRFLDISANSIMGFVESGRGCLPGTLTTLIAAQNGISSTRGLSHCQALLKVHLDGNKITALDELAALGGLRALRHLTVAGNPVAANPRLLNCLTASIAKLTTLDGMTLSQAQANRKVIANVSEARNRSMSVSSSATRRADPTSESAMHSSLALSSSAIRTRSSVARSRCIMDDADEEDERGESEAAIAKRADELKIRRLEARVNELRKLTGESEKREADLKSKQRQLQSQLRRADAIFDEQDLQLTQLRDENEQLGNKALSLQRTVSSLENAFRSQHATVVYSKIYNRSNSSSGALHSSRASSQRLGA